MSWGRIDDRFWLHPKAESASLESLGILGLLWSYAGFLQRSRFPKQVALTKVARGRIDLLDELVKIGFLEENGDDYIIHDWDDYQPPKPKKSPQELSKLRRKAANVRWSKGDANADADAMQVHTPASLIKQTFASTVHPDASGLHNFASEGNEQNHEVTDALSRPDPNPNPTQPEPDDLQLELNLLFDEWYNRGGPTKKDGTPFRENFEEFERQFRRRGIKLEDFAPKVRLRLDRFDVDDRRDRSFSLGMLRTFLTSGNWKDEKGPPKKVAPLEKKVVEADMTLDLQEL